MWHSIASQIFQIRFDRLHFGEERCPTRPTKKQQHKTNTFQFSNSQLKSTEKSKDKFFKYDSDLDIQFFTQRLK